MIIKCVNKQNCPCSKWPCIDICDDFGQIDVSLTALKLVNTLMAIQPCYKCENNEVTKGYNCEGCHWQNIGTKNNFKG